MKNASIIVKVGSRKRVKFSGEFDNRTLKNEQCELEKIHLSE